jgi:hypothetical protein
MPLNLILGDVIFYSLELPEQIGPLGGTQTLVVHEFPGGAKTVDSLGAFPNTLSWKGIFTGATAFARAFQVDRMRALGLEVLLTYGPQAFVGKIDKFDYNPKHQHFIPYTVSFEPIEDLSGIGAVSLFPPSIDQALSAVVTEFNDVVAGDDGLPLPFVLDADAVAVTTAVSIGLLNGNGTVAGISATDEAAIVLEAYLLEQAAAPLIAGTDPTQASPALDISAQAACMAAIVASTTAPARQFNMVNPNLFVVAAMYLGDSSLWQQIAAASGLPPDPQPIGMFLIVVPTT